MAGGSQWLLELRYEINEPSDMSSPEWFLVYGFSNFLPYVTILYHSLSGLRTLAKVCIEMRRC